MNKIIFILLFVATTMSLISSGCITSNPSTPSKSERWLNAMYARIAADYEEVIAINESKINGQLEADGFHMLNETNSSQYFRDFWIWMPTNGSYNVLTITIIADQSNASKQSWLDVRLSSSFPESEIAKNKNWTIAKVNAVINICNLTSVDWNTATWKYSYQD